MLSSKCCGRCRHKNTLNRWKARGSPQLSQFILRGTWTSTKFHKNPSNSCWDISVWTKVVGWLYHAASKALEKQKQGRFYCHVTKSTTHFLHQVIRENIDGSAQKRKAQLWTAWPPGVPRWGNATSSLIFCHCYGFVVCFYPKEFYTATICSSLSFHVQLQCTYIVEGVVMLRDRKRLFPVS